MKHQWIAFLVMVAALGCGNITRECPSGLTACDNTCSDMQTDNMSCGTCGNVCGAMEQCVNGSCQCASGGKLCGATCVDSATDEANCGDCGVTCDTAAGEVCEGGTCGCPTGQMECGGVCLDVLTDAQHCGSCTNACDVGTNCVNGACGCPAGQNDCSGTCADFQTDNAHCGNCTTVCSGGQTCQSADCACTGANIIECNDVCYDKQTSNDHCGTCNNMCINGKTCQSGACQCTGGLSACSDGFCYDVSSDRMHCGSGCTSCNGSQLCNNACVTAPTLTFTSLWDTTTGWTVPNNTPIQLSFALSPTTAAPGITYECRTFLKSATTFPAFTKCDGGNGTGTTYRPTAGPNGTYRTEVRYLQNGVVVGTTIFHEYYAHTNLNNVAKCTLPAGLSDAAIFTLAANTTLSGWSVPTTPLFSDAALDLTNPTIVVPFKQVQGSRSMGNTVSTWGTFPKDFTVRDLSLRHKWVLDSSKKLLLMKRNYIAPGGGCANISNFHHAGSFNFAQCEAFVMNINGVGLCIGRNAAGTAPEVKGTAYVAGWWRMRSSRYNSKYNDNKSTTRYCADASCNGNTNLIVLPP